MALGDFFSGLGDVLTQQFSLGDSKLHSLDVVKDGRTVSYGKLGEFAKKFDQSAERSYTEEGWFKTDPFNPRQKQLQILMQEPDLTILVKKRAFSSLVENYKNDLLSHEEKLFVRATKFLFQNKCRQITAYERLTKLAAVATEIGSVDYHLLPILFASTDLLSPLFSGGSAFDSFKATVDRVRTIANLSQDNIYTTWTTNVLNSFRTDLGEGTGVIEFTTALNVSTTTSVNFGAGSFNITFSDPYNLMIITQNDIEQAIVDATSTVIGSQFVQLGLQQLEEGIQADKELLNKIRRARGANPINFIVNPDTFLGKRIRAIVDNVGKEIVFQGSLLKVTIDSAYLFGGPILEQDGLNNSNLATGFLGKAYNSDNMIDPIRGLVGSPITPNSEVKIFSRIIRSLFNRMQIEINSRKAIKAHNAETNDLRKKLRLHYGSKLVIQPMDVVHIFVRSKTQIDNKILGGLQDSVNAVGFLQTANKALLGLQDFFDAGKDNSVEKSIYVGKNFPNWLWLIMRGTFTSDKSGTQIFAGLVNDSSSNYSNGAYTAVINGKDNAAYFNVGVVNYKPALNVWNGSLYDPITPFNIKFDKANGFQKDKIPDLLQENQDLFKSAFLKYKNGLYVGKKPNVNNFVQDTENIKNNSVRRVFYDPDGMVYKWKEGIGTLVMFGNDYQESQENNVGVPPITSDPFAGQDVMNVLSLLITGEPYNFATFYKAASNFDNFGRDSQTGADPAVSYFKNFQTDLRKRNLMYGNFVPFKQLSMDTETYKNILNSQIRAQGFDDELNTLLAKRADLQDRISASSTLDIGEGASKLQPFVNDLNEKISFKQNQISQELKKTDKPISLIGNDVSFDYNPSLGTGDKNKLHSAYNNNKDLRRRLNYLTRRVSWKVRANEDVNFFIVDDTYDKDYDIQAFEKSFVNPDLFRSDYITVDQQIRRVAELLDLEVFADSQGHIRIRPPQYNKVPSSVFYRMLKLKKELDIQIYPQFLEDLYVNQVENILSKIEVLEDEIRMYGLAFAQGTDTDLERFLSVSSQSFNSSLSTFKFLSSEDTGSISRIALKYYFQTDNQQEANNALSSGLTALKSVHTQAAINNILTTSTRGNLLETAYDQLQDASLNAILSANATITRQDQLNSRLETKTGQKFDLRQLFPNSAKLLGGNKISQGDLFRILQELTSRVSERQKILKIASAAVAQAEEGLSFIKNKDRISNKLIVPGMLNNTNIPSGFDNIIEDESYDDYGPGSGNRYVIKAHQIKSISITEHTPNYTAVEVRGNFADNFIKAPSNLDNSTTGGNALTTVLAVDYDLWRMYGVKVPTSVPAPFLTDPQTQCAPFAVSLLTRARKQINDNSRITIVGNEFMQAGEVIYIDYIDRLFYVESVSHNFSYGREFTTNLNLAYGHMPGEYIPTYLDTVGKVLYKNREITNMVNMKHDNVNNEEHLGVIVGNPATTNFASTPEDQISQGIFKDLNRQALTEILQSAQSAFSVSDANYQPILEIRVYYASKSGFGTVSPNVSKLAMTVQKCLEGSDNSLAEAIKIPQPNQLLNNNKLNIKVYEVDSDNILEYRSPSAQAYNMARATLIKKSTRSPENIQKVDQVIYNFIVDCWIKFSPAQ